MTKDHRPVGLFLAKKLRGLDEQLAATIPRVQGEQDEEAIHDMRVAIRRLRTILRLGRAVYGRFHADAVRRAFADVQRATGNLRDEEVLGETLGDIPVTDPRFVAWRARRRARERALRREMQSHLRSGELARARTLLVALVTLTVRPARDVDVAKFARRAVDDARRTVEKKRDCPSTDALGLHELRIAYKNLRYTVEIFAEALPHDLAAMEKPAAHFQKRLGEIHDVDMALQTVGRARGLPPRVRSRLAKELSTQRQERVGRYLSDMAPVPPATTNGARLVPRSATDPSPTPGAALDSGRSPPSG